MRRFAGWPAFDFGWIGVTFRWRRMAATHTIATPGSMSSGPRLGSGPSDSSGDLLRPGWRSSDGRHLRRPGRRPTVSAQTKAAYEPPLTVCRAGEQGRRWGLVFQDRPAQRMRWRRSQSSPRCDLRRRRGSAPRTTVRATLLPGRHGGKEALEATGTDPEVSGEPDPAVLRAAWCAAGRATEFAARSAVGALTADRPMPRLVVASVGPDAPFSERHPC
jgi:hypothetical protein